VVHVPVHDQHARAARDQVGGDDRDVVEQAEPHRPIAQRVVARRAHRHEPDALAPARQLLDDAQPGAGGELGERERVVGGVGVLVEVAPALVAEDAQLLEVRGVVDAGELRARRRRDVQAHQVLAQVQVGHAGPRRGEPVGPLGMSRVGVAPVVERSVGDEGHRARGFRASGEMSKRT